MTTHCLTVFKTAEMDGQTMQEAACLWRHFDGNPDIHLAEARGEA